MSLPFQHMQAVRLMSIFTTSVRALRAMLTICGGGGDGGGRVGGGGGGGGGGSEDKKVRQVEGQL